MKVLYFLALVVLCLAAPIDSPPKDLKVTVHEHNGKISFTARWTPVDGNISGYIGILSKGTLYSNIIEKDDGKKTVEVYAPTNPEKPIEKIDEFEVPADQNEHTYEGIQKGVVYDLVILADSDEGRGPPSEHVMFAFM